MANATARGRPARGAQTRRTNPWRISCSRSTAARCPRRRKNGREGHVRPGPDWFGTLGDKLVDGGNPVSNTKTIAPGGSVSETSNPPSGYSIIKADSLDEAVELAKGCPVLQGGASVVVAETFPVM